MGPLIRRPPLTAFGRLGPESVLVLGWLSTTWCMPRPCDHTDSYPDRTDDRTGAAYTRVNRAAETYDINCGARIGVGRWVGWQRREPRFEALINNI